MDWLRQEERMIEQEIRRKSPVYINKKYLFLIFVLGILSVLPQMDFLHSCPNKCGFFPDTWICKKCGYDNYEGIGRCAVCGTEKGKKN